MTFSAAYMKLHKILTTQKYFLHHKCPYLLNKETEMVIEGRM
jgi:hypothetical protein